MSRINDVLSALERLSITDLRHAVDAGRRLLDQRASITAVEGVDATAPSCPHCQAATANRWGTTRTGLQRWRCGACRRTYTAATGTPLAAAKRRDEFVAVAQDMLETRPLSCRQMAERIGVHPMTVWRWRKLIMEACWERVEALGGIVEVDETYVRESRKGSREWKRYEAGHGPQPPRLQWHQYKRRKLPMQRGLSRYQMPVLTATNRGQGVYAGRLAGTSLAPVSERLDQVLRDDAVLCTDSAAVYRQYAGDRNRPIKQVNPHQGIHVVEQAFHINTVGSLHQRFKEFMAPFRGPNTRHLEAYTAWFIVRERFRGRTKNRNMLVQKVIERRPPTYRPSPFFNTLR
ncbi:MAG: IS1595 family transposase [Alphaproteobacteria bacterium]|jgi:transposase-like protein|nr:IS1595 family transposase [Alphaproteobacteria bacterium]